VIAALLAVAVLVVPAGPATAADEVVIRKVDSTRFPTVTISTLVTGEAPELTRFALRENGRIVPRFDVVPLAETTTPVGIVLVIDTSGSMRPGGKLEQAKAAARQFVAQKLANDQIALVAFSNEPRVVVNFTDDPVLLNSAIDALAPAGETALWDAVRTAAGLLVDRADFLPYMVVLSDGADTVSATSADEALGAATAAKAAVFAVGLLGGGDFDANSLRRLAATTGGTYDETTDSRQLSRLYGAVQRVLQNQYEITYTSAASGPVTIDVVAGGVKASTNVVPNTVAGPAQPRVLDPVPIPPPLRGSSGRTLVVVLVVLAATLGAVALVVFVGPDRAVLADALRPYSAGASEGVALPRRERTLAETAVVRRAVEATARLAGGRGVLEKLERRLDQADLRLRPQEALFFFLMGVVILTVAALALAGPFPAAAVLFVAGLVPVAVLNQLAERRQRAFNRQLPDTLQLLASSLRAGYSLLQGLEAVAAEVDDPMGRELRRAVVEARLGRPLEEALDDTARRMTSPDFEWTVTAIRIQREVGGNLAELLNSVSDTMIARERMRREVRALTAEGRFSAIILGALPVIIGVVIYILNPGYILTLFGQVLGKVMVLGSVVLAFLGFLWMRKIIEIEV
jgi:tight adherence protein B